MNHNDAVRRALVGARKDGKSIFAGKKVTGFSDAEEEALGRGKVKMRSWYTFDYLFTRELGGAILAGDQD